MRRLTAALAVAVLAAGGCGGGAGEAGRNGVRPPASSGAGEDGAGRAGPEDPAGRTGGGSSGNSEDGPGNGSGDGGLVELRVLADESLTGAFGAVEQGFEQQHPSVEVVVTYAEGGDLARRIAGGEPADVFATDDLVAMRTVTDAAAAARPVEFAGGRLTVTVLPQVAAPAAATSFVEFLREGDGKRILIESGLLRP